MRAIVAHAARTEPLVVSAPDARPEPFPGRYEPRLERSLRAALAAKAPLRTTLAGLAPTLVDPPPFGDPAGLVARVDTPAEPAAAGPT